MPLPYRGRGHRIREWNLPHDELSLLVARQADVILTLDHSKEEPLCSADQLAS